MSISRLETHSLRLPGSVDAREPGHTVFNVLLELWLELSLHQCEIIHRSKAQDTESRILLASAIHQRAASLAEMVAHPFAGTDRLGHCENAQILLPSLVRQMVVGNAEVGCKHRGMEFVTI
jgi:hypothetical protein